MELRFILTYTIYGAMGMKLFIVVHYSIYIGIDFYICFYLYFFSSIQRRYAYNKMYNIFNDKHIFFCLYDYMCLTHLHGLYIHINTSKCSVLWSGCSSLLRFFFTFNFLINLRCGKGIFNYIFFVN